MKHLRSSTIGVSSLVLSAFFLQAASGDPSGVSLNVKPGDDFYGFANEEWLKTTEIPAGKNSWSDVNRRSTTTTQQLIGLVEAAATAAAGSYQRQAADFYLAYMNTALIEAKGIAPLKPSLKRIDGLGDKAGLARMLGGELRPDADPFNFGVMQSPHLFGVAVEHGVHGETTPFAYLMQGGLGAQDRDLYLNPSAETQAIRKRYEEYIAHQLQAAGFDHAAQRAAQVMALETAIARTQLSAEESAKIDDPKDRWTVSEFSAKAPGLDWSAFFAAAGLSKRKDLVAFQPSAIGGEAAAVQNFPLDTWKDYLRFHLIDENADILPHTFARQVAAVKNPREERAIDAVNRALPDALGQMYVAKYFPPATKAQVQTILANVMEAFEKRIEKVQWMTPATRAQSVAKIKSIYFGVGYPEKWTSYATLTVKPEDAFGNRQRAAEWNYQKELAKLGQPNDPQEWVTSPQTVNGLYNPLQNNYNISAAMLQPPKFDAAGSTAANYGGIGYVLGHELSHFVDTLGEQTDTHGAMRHWWTAEDVAHYETSTDPLVKQFAGYHAFPDLPVNGKLTLSENVADLAGLNSAFDAYRGTLGNKIQDKAYVREQDRQFFIGYARAWRVTMRDAAVRDLVATNTHAPQAFRVATVRNLDAWYDAFDVVPGQRYYLEPAARVHVW
jgi:putative endopeptidase